MVVGVDQLLDCYATDCGCGGCEGCSDCSGGDCSCPNLVAGNCITLDKTNPAQITISTECPPEVISTDGTVGITITEDEDDDHTIYDLSVACDDNKVGACAQDTTPSYLYNDKLRVDTSGPLTYSLINCPGNAYVQIGFDASQLPTSDEDKKVAVSAGCASGYLNDRVIVGDGLKTEIVGCKLKISFDCDTDDCDNPHRGAIVQTYLVNTLNTSQAVALETPYYITTGAVTELDALGWTHVTGSWREDIKTGCITHSGGLITIDKGGRYAIDFDGHQEQSHHVHATRVGLIVIFPNGVIRIVQSRYSGVQGSVATGIGSGSADEAIADNASTTANGGGGTTFSMGRWFERLPVGKHRRMALPTNTKIVPFYRVSTVMTGDTNAAGTGTFSLLGENESFVGGYDGFTFGVNYIDSFCDSLEWSDSDACSC